MAQLSRHLSRAPGPIEKNRLQGGGAEITRPQVALVTLKAGHVRPVWAGHPWVFAQAVESIRGGAQPGDEVEVQDAEGHWLGRGLYSPGSAIVVRIYGRQKTEHLDASFFERRIHQALERRQAVGLPAPGTDAYRVLHAEGDELPGVIVDRYGETLAVQWGTIGIQRREALLLSALQAALNPRAIIDRTTQRAAQAEGFRANAGVVRGHELSELRFEERGLSYRVPRDLTQKTGFYLDQRPLRARVEELAKDAHVLDTFTYIGSFAMSAARGGAQKVHAVDASAPAMEVAAECAALNGLADRIHFEKGDAAAALAEAGRQGGYDLVICDPPKLAPTRAAKKKALSATRRMAAAGARATRPGGLLVLCSCAAAVGVQELTRAVALGARDAGLGAVVLERHFQGPDHPVVAAFPEGLYLSSLIVQITPR